jgi:hypothetical protein
MDLYDRIFNITNKNIKKTIIEAINKCNELINNTEGMCMVASNIIYNFLLDQHILARIINTKELGIGYEHEAVIVKDKDNYYLIDFTYNQFLKVSSLLNKELLKNKFLQIDDETFNKYLDSIPKFYKFENISLNNIFISTKKR